MKTVCFLGPDGSGKSTIIPLVANRLNELNVYNEKIVTTRPIHGVEHSFQYRKELVDKDTSAHDRFMAAWHLYNLNLHSYIHGADRNDMPEILLIERGFSSMLTYNRVNRWPESYQISLIPKVDLAVYIDSPFESLTERLSTRVTTDFQDLDYEYREYVYNQGILDLVTCSEQLGVPVFIVDNYDHNPVTVAVNQIVEEIIRVLVK